MGFLVLFLGERWENTNPALRSEQIRSTVAALGWFGNQNAEPHYRGGGLEAPDGIWALLPWISLWSCFEIHPSSIHVPALHEAHLPSGPTLGPLYGSREPLGMHWYCFLCSIPTLPRSCTPHGINPIIIHQKKALQFQLGFQQIQKWRLLGKHRTEAGPRCWGHKESDPDVCHTTHLPVPIKTPLVGLQRLLGLDDVLIAKAQH